MKSFEETFSKMPGAGLSAEDMIAILHKQIFEYSRCRKCNCHLEEVMEGFLCRHCFLKANRTKRLPDKPLRIFTHWSSESRAALDLRVPADCRNAIVVRQPGHVTEVKQKQDSDKKSPQFPKHVEEYLRGLLVILVEPIASLNMASFIEIKKDLMKRGVKFVNSSFKTAEKNKRIIVADLAPYSKHSRADLDSLAKDFRCPVVELSIFLRSLKSGINKASSSRMSLEQTPEKEKLLWEDPFKRANPPILDFKSYDDLVDKL